MWIDFFHLQVRNMLASGSWYLLEQVTKGTVLDYTKNDRISINIIFGATE